MSAVRLVRIASSRCGPPTSANGGWTAGLLAGLLLEHAGQLSGVPVTVTLRRPPPLDVDLPVRLTGDDARATATLQGPPGDGNAEDAPPVAIAVLNQSAAVSPVSPVDVTTATAAERRFTGLRDHPFPTCFVCGTARTAGDGLRLQPGRVDGGRTACTWTPHPNFSGRDGRTDPASVWAALDCPGGWTTDLSGRPLVLGRMTALVHRQPAGGEQLVVVGRHLDTEGRKTRTATTVYDAAGGIVGRADQLWISVDPATFR